MADAVTSMPTAGAACAPRPRLATPPKRCWGSVALAALLATSGCSTALSSFAPAHVPRKGGFQAEAGLDVSIPTGTLTRSVDAARTLAKTASSRTLTADEKLLVFDAGANLALNPPSVLQHARIAYAPAKRTELSIRYAGGGWRLGGRYQLWEQGVDAGWDLTVGVGASRQAVSFPVGDVISVLKVKGFERYAVDLPIAFGRRGPWYRVWGGPRLLYTTGHSVMILTVPAGDTTTATADSSGLYYGGQAGFALGYQKLFLGVELNLVQFKGHADLAASGLGNRRVNLDTFVVYPGIALMGEF